MAVALSPCFQKVLTLADIELWDGRAFGEAYFSGGRCWDGLNRYAYCYNNPVRYTDPTGHRTGDSPGDVTVNTITGQVHEFGGGGHGGAGQPSMNGADDGKPKPPPSAQPNIFQQIGDWFGDNGDGVRALALGIGLFTVGQLIESAAPIVGDAITIGSDGAAIVPAVAVAGAMTALGQAVKVSGAAAVLTGLALFAKGKTHHGEGRSGEASSGDPNRNVGDVNKVKADGKAFIDSKTGNTVYVQGNKVYVESPKGEYVTTFHNTKANTARRIESGRWVPIE